jgi:hypothetical protein
MTNWSYLAAKTNMASTYRTWLYSTSPPPPGRSRKLVDKYLGDELAMRPLSMRISYSFLVESLRTAALCLMICPIWISKLGPGPGHGNSPPALITSPGSGVVAFGYLADSIRIWNGPRISGGWIFRPFQLLRRQLHKVPWILSRDLAG